MMMIITPSKRNVVILKVGLDEIRWDGLSLGGVWYRAPYPMVIMSNFGIEKFVWN